MVRIGVGYDLTYDLPQPTPMLLTVHVHYSRASDLEAPDYLITVPPVPITGYRDSFGNWITRVVATAGQFRLSCRAVLKDSGLPDAVCSDAQQHAVQDLTEETLLFLLGSRYCETDRLSDIAWKLFEHAPMGWGRVQAICDYVHTRIKFGYEHARPTKTAFEAHEEQAGVCRDYAHLAVAFCRCMNIPARYCTGYLTDIGLPVTDAPGDFSGWFEAYLGGQWHVFDARFNTPRIGRVLMARGRDAADVAIATTFGPNLLTNFQVYADEAKD